MEVNYIKHKFFDNLNLISKLTAIVLAAYEHTWKYTKVKYFVFAIEAEFAFVARAATHSMNECNLLYKYLYNAYEPR